jgi:mannose-6-phosphate isomerase-like protein (cupin superfamily)
VTVTIRRFDEIPWHVPPTDAKDLDLDLRPADDEPGRKFLVRGDGGFHVQVVRIPPDFDAPVHTHSHAEVFMILEGSCTFNGTAMRRFDSTVVDAGEAYGFRSGPDGVMFLVTRGAVATFSAV